MTKIFTTALLFFALISPASAEEDMWEYQMIKGDSLWTISHTFLKDWRNWAKLQDLNAVTQDKKMRPGRVIRIPVQWLDIKDAPARIVTSSGAVQLFDGLGAELRFTDTTPVKAGYALETQENASALLAFEDGSKMLVQQSTRIEFDTASAVGSGLVYSYKIGLPQGKVENRANPLRTPGSTFLVETPSSVTATRGTIYRVGTDGLVTGTEVTQGNVDVGNDLGNVPVKEGFGLITEKGKAPSKPVKLLDAPEIAADFGRFRYLPSSVNWQPVAGAVSYHVQISTSEDFTSLSYDLFINDTALLLPLSIEDNSYYLRVRAVDKASLEGSDASSQFIVAANPLPAVHLSSAAQLQQYNDDINLRWTQVKGAQQYLVEVALASDARAIVHRSKPISEPNYRFTLNDRYGNYQWRVTGINANQELGPAGHYGQFELIQRPYRPEKKSLDTASLLVNWPFVPAKTTFQVQLARDEAFSDIVVEKQASSASNDLGNIARGDYYLRYLVLDETGKVSNKSPTHKVRW